VRNCRREGQRYWRYGGGVWVRIVQALLHHTHNLSGGANRCEETVQ
jgi:hypothetical protein